MGGSDFITGRFFLIILTSSAISTLAVGFFVFFFLSPGQVRRLCPVSPLVEMVGLSQLQ
jgi:hypothetical protein